MSRRRCRREAVPVAEAGEYWLNATKVPNCLNAIKIPNCYPAEYWLNGFLVSKECPGWLSTIAQRQKGADP